MPPQELAFRTQKAVLWPRESFDPFGKPVVGDPVEISVRWEEELAVTAQATGATGMLIVDRQIPTRSSMWLGELANWSGVRPDEDETGSIMEVIEYHEIPDLKGRVSLRQVMVVRARSSWPNTSGDAGVDPELSSVSYNKLQALADDLDTIVFTLELLTSNGEPITGRTVLMSLSSSVGISYNDSPQDTDSQGVARLRLKATDPLTATVTFRTNEDGEILRRLSIAFVEP